MEQIEITLKVPKQGYELAQALGDLGVSLVQNAKDGISLAEIVKILVENSDAIRLAVEGIAQIPEELKAGAGKFSVPFALQGDRIAQAVKLLNQPQV